MKKQALVVAFLAFAVVVAAPAFAQTEPSDPRFSVKIESRPSGGFQYSITNLSDIPITAIAVAVAQTSDHSRTSGVLTFDSVLQSGGSHGAILPQKTYSFPIGSAASTTKPAPPSVEVQLRAIVFADGSSYGDPEWVDAVTQSRQFAWDDANAVLGYVQTAKAGTVPMDQLIQELNEKDQALMISRTGSDARHLMHTRYYRDMALNIAAPKNLAPGVTWDLGSNLERISEQMQNLRQQIYYSKPQIPAAKQLAANAVPPAPTQFVIHIPDNIDTARIHVEYHLIRAQDRLPGPHVIGGYGLVADPQVGDHEYVIPTDEADEPAIGILVAVYSPGCQLMAIVVPSLIESSRSADYQCQLATPVEFTGRISPSDLLVGHDYEVQIAFTGWVGGPNSNAVTALMYTFSLSTVTPDANGVFHAQVPGLTGTVVIGSMRQHADPRLVFSVSDKRSSSSTHQPNRTFAYLNTVGRASSMLPGADFPQSTVADVTFTVQGFSQN